jgi:hypothetical protein
MARSATIAFIQAGIFPFRHRVSDVFQADLDSQLLQLFSHADDVADFVVKLAGANV